MLEVTQLPRPRDGRRRAEGLPFSLTLRRAVREDHLRVERAFDLPGRLGDAERFAELLGIWSLLWADAAAAQDPPVGDGPAEPVEVSEERARLALLAAGAVRDLGADLQDLTGLTGAGAPTGVVGAPAVGPLAGLVGDAAGVWAVSYVLRELQLGSRVVIASARTRLALPDGCAERYLSSGGSGDSAGRGGSGSQWVHFRTRLDAWALTADPAEQSATITAARLAFAVVDLAAQPPTPTRGG